MAPATGKPPVQAVFIKDSVLPKRLRTRDICSACEAVSGDKSIDGATLANNLWRILPFTEEARLKLLKFGIYIQGKRIFPESINPFLIEGGESTITKIFVSGLPWEFDESLIERALTAAGYTVKGKLININKEKWENGTLTTWRDGQWTGFILFPKEKLNTSIKMGDFLTSIRYNGMQRSMTCYHCQGEGHIAKDCPNEVKCRSCQQTGHKAGDPACPKYRPKPGAEPRQPEPAGDGQGATPSNEGEGERQNAAASPQQPKPSTESKGETPSDEGQVVDLTAEGQGSDSQESTSGTATTKPTLPQDQSFSDTTLYSEVVKNNGRVRANSGKADEVRTLNNLTHYMNRTRHNSAPGKDDEKPSESTNTEETVKLSPMTIVSNGNRVDSIPSGSRGGMSVQHSTPEPANTGEDENTKLKSVWDPEDFESNADFSKLSDVNKTARGVFSDFVDANVSEDAMFSDKSRMEEDPQSSMNHAETGSGDVPPVTPLSSQAGSSFIERMSSLFSNKGHKRDKPDGSPEVDSEARQEGQRLRLAIEF